MDECCDHKAAELVQFKKEHANTLKVVLFINLSMFLLESIYGWISHSSALFADSLDMMGDTLVYAMSLYALEKNSVWNARVSLTKGTIMGLLGTVSFALIIYRFFSPTLPHTETMMWVGIVALAANLFCLFLLFRHREDNINMRSTWICSRNDVIANFSVLVAAAFVEWTQSQYPDVIIASLVTYIVLKSSYRVIRESLRALKNPPLEGQASVQTDDQRGTPK